LGRDAAKTAARLGGQWPDTNDRHWLSPTPYDSSFPTGVPSARRTVRPILLRVASWTEASPIDWQSGATFSRDGSLFATGTELGDIRLLNPITQQELARLVDPSQDRAGNLAFTADSSRLINCSDDGKAIHIWDLRLVRKQLAEMGLDWDAPALVEPSEKATVSAKQPLAVEVDPPDLHLYMSADGLLTLARRYKQSKDYRKSLELLRQALKVNPLHAESRNELAWLLVTGPIELRQPSEALELARRTSAYARDQSKYQNTLGVAFYRNKQYTQAIAVLEESLQLGHGTNDGHNLFFLAMCHHRLGHPKEARDCQQRAIEWFRDNRLRLSTDAVDELTAFQTESAAELATSPQK
jgi:tetratricopeptide (TPR) repeat protein